MSTITFDSASKQFTVSYSYTNAKGKVKTVSPKPRGLTALANQVLKAQQRAAEAFTASVSSEDLSTLAAVVTVSGTASNVTVSIVGYGAESTDWPTLGDALREVVRLSKEYSVAQFKKDLRKKRVSISVS